VDLKVPDNLTSKQDIAHIHLELRLFNDKAMQSIMRHEDPVKYPAISDRLRALASENQIDLRDTKACESLLARLEDLKSNAPAVHISFPVDPSVEVLQKLIVWLRKEVDPRIIIQVGLQPTIAAGIVLRTPNKQFDFSLRRHLYKNRDKLLEVLKGEKTADKVAAQ